MDFRHRSVSYVAERTDHSHAVRPDNPNVLLTGSVPASSKTAVIIFFCGNKSSFLSAENFSNTSYLLCGANSSQMAVISTDSDGGGWIVNVPACEHTEEFEIVSTASHV